VPQAGDYRLALTAYADNVGGDSFFVTVNAGPVDGYLHSIENLNGIYYDDYVNNRGVIEPIVVQLPAGPALVAVHQREAGARIDTIGIESAEDAVTIAAADRVLDGSLEAWGIIGTLADMSTYYSAGSNAE